MKKPKINKAEQKKVDQFNAKYAVGDKVIVEKDNGDRQECVVKHPATLLQGHTAVGWFTGISGCYILDRVR